MGYTQAGFNLAGTC